MTHTPSKTNTTSIRRPDCVTEVRMGNTGLTVCDTSANGVGQGNNLSCKARAFLQ